MSDSVNQLMNYEAVCRTAPATPGLSNTLQTNTMTADLLKVHGGVPSELYFVRSCVSTNKFPGNKRMFNSPLPES